MLVRTVVVALLVAVTVIAAGCRSGNFANENDELRRRVHELEDQNDDLRRRTGELESALAAATASRGAGAPAGAAAAEVPMVAEIEIDRRSHVDESAGGGEPDLLRLYVTSQDGRGRFVQMAGTLSVNVARLPANAPAETVTRLDVDPGTLRDAYRSSFMGTHYTIEMPLPAHLAGTLDVRVHYTDARTGSTLDAHRAITVRSESASQRTPTRTPSSSSH